MTWLEKLIEPAVLANLIVAAAAIWYTIETKKLRRTAAEQLKTMNSQINLAKKAAALALNASFLQVFPIIEKHHSSEVAEYRRFARHDLPNKCAAARADGKTLKEADPCAAKTASDVANYYESLGMLIVHGKNKLLSEVESMLLDMVQVSAHDIWEIFYANLDVIHESPKNIGTWAGSFERLYFRIAVFNSALPATKPKLKRV